jgi:hypothetical protein
MEVMPILTGENVLESLPICEVCLEKLNGPTISLGDYPLCDDLHSDATKSIELPLYSQTIRLCGNCLTAQQLAPVKKELLFKRDYKYRSRLTLDVLDGMKDLALESQKKGHYQPGQAVLDIGCNDGSLLRYFKGSGALTIGVEPSDAILENDGAIDFSFQEYFDVDTVSKILELNIEIGLITMTNVFAHIENLSALLENLSRLVTSNTTIVIENHYLGEIIGKNQFDTFYHEHPRTYSQRSFEYIAERLNMRLVESKLTKRYGGNIRVTLQSGSKSARNQSSLNESNFVENFSELQSGHESWRTRTQHHLGELVAREGAVLGRSLPGRAVMLINSLGLNSSVMPALFEKNSSPKCGNFVPGTDIPILPESQMPLDSGSPAFVIWAWHISGEVANHMRLLGVTAEMYTHLPSWSKV